MGKKSMRKSASKWHQSGERALLEIWSEKMPQLRGCRRNSHILQEMASELQAHGFKYTAGELKTKMHNMTCRYRKEKQRIEAGGSPSEWDFYTDMEDLFAPFKNYHTEGLVVDSINNIYLTTATYPPLSISSVSSRRPSPLVSSPSPSPPPSVPHTSKLRTSIRKNKFDKFIKFVEESMTKIQSYLKSTSERLVAIEEEKKEILKSFAAKEAEVQEALIDFLRKP